jgi:hypothetical protein
MQAPATYSLPNISINKYMLIVRPSEQILERTKRLQHKWKNEFDLQDIQLQSGYLLLAKFNQVAAQEERLLRKLHYAAMECAPYRIRLEGFYGYPEHAIGIKIDTPETVKQINRLIQIHLSGIRFPGERPYYNHYPAIGLASRLEPEQYRNIWPKIANKHFSGAFTADHMMVLRKGPYQKGWSMLERFTFENLPIQSKQGVLFA